MKHRNFLALLGGGVILAAGDSLGLHQSRNNAREDWRPTYAP